MAARFNETVLNFSKVIRANKKGAWFILGGHGPSPIPEYMLRKTGADVIVIGEFEKHIIDLLKCKINNGSLSEVKNIAYVEKGVVKINECDKPVLKTAKSSSGL